MLKHFQKNSFAYGMVLTILFLFSVGAGRAIMDSGLRISFEPDVPVAVNVDPAPVNVEKTWTVKEPAADAEFISGPLVAEVGQLCVFRLNDPNSRADWVIVPEATCYVDSSGASLAFASNAPAKYTIIAAIVEEGVPKILTHICEYGLQPQPDPSPTPNPDPKPEPSPNISLKDWVSQSVPQSGRHQCAALASCYEATASAIESGSLQSLSAAFATIRTASQTKIDVDIWSDFLEALSPKITTALGGSTDVKKLGTILREIAEGLKAVSDTSLGAEPDISVLDIYPFTNSIERGAA